MQANRPTVSVVIPAKDAASTIERQLKALLRQDTDVAFEVVVADNGSADGTSSIVERWFCRFEESPDGPRKLNLVDAGRTPGINAARNRGVEVSRSQIILFCDADDEVCPDWLSAHVDAFRNGASCTAGGLIKVLPDGKILGVTEADFVYPGVRFRHAVGANCGVSRAVFDQIGGFDEAFMHGSDEIDFFWRAAYLGHEVTPVSNAKIYYFARGSTKEVFRQNYRYGIGNYQLLRRHQNSLELKTPSLARSSFVIAKAAGALLLSKRSPTRRRSSLSRMAFGCGSIAARLGRV